MFKKKVMPMLDPNAKVLGEMLAEKKASGKSVEKLDKLKNLRKK